MKIFLIFLGVIIFASGSFSAMARNPDDHMKHMMVMQNGKDRGHDERISLGNSPEVKQHQLANMRGHVKAIQTITKLLSEDKFNEASKIAHEKLGLTPEMEKMCNMFDNAEFRKMGRAFHESGDKLGDILKTGNMSKSLEAMNDTLNYCVQCHATFRQ